MTSLTTRLSSENNPDISGKLNDKLVVSALFLLVCVTWGTTWIGIKIAVETIPPILASGIRFLIAFPVLYAIARKNGAPLMFLRKDRGLFWMVVLLYFALPYLFINVGEQYVSSGLAALLFSTMPLFILILSAFMLREKIWVTQLIGIALSFCSLFMILVLHHASMEYKNALGVVGILLAAMLHALCYVTTKMRGAQINILTFNTLPIGIAGVLLTVVGVVYEQPDIDHFSGNSIAALVYLGIVASVGGFLAYFYLLKRLSPIVLSFVFLIFPIIAVILSNLIDSQSFSAEFAFYVALLIFGFALAKIQKGPLSRAE